MWPHDYHTLKCLLNTRFQRWSPHFAVITASTLLGRLCTQFWNGAVETRVLTKSGIDVRREGLAHSCRSSLGFSGVEVSALRRALRSFHINLTSNPFLYLAICTGKKCHAGTCLSHLLSVKTLKKCCIQTLWCKISILKTKDKIVILMISTHLH